MNIETLHVGGCHNHFPDERRIQLDLAGLVSFYDTELVVAVVAVCAGQDRWDRHAGDGDGPRKLPPLSRRGWVSYCILSRLRMWFTIARGDREFHRVATEMPR